jgi:head-tail adaptor
MARRDVNLIRQLNHRVTLCSASDVLAEPGKLSLVREGVLTCWAAITPSRSSYFSREGAAVMERADYYSHHVFIRYRTDISVRSTAWVYEARLKSEPRWFKVVDVLNVDEDSRFWRLSCRLVEASDLVRPPDAPGTAAAASIAAPLPDGIEL